jgi:hypothetical protein
VVYWLTTIKLISDTYRDGLLEVAKGLFWIMRQLESDDFGRGFNGPLALGVVLIVDLLPPLLAETGRVNFLSPFVRIFENVKSTEKDGPSADVYSLSTYVTISKGKTNWRPLC